jgi:integration host factor subunit alpha
MKRQNISKNNVLREIYSNLGIPITFSGKILDSILEIIAEGLNKNSKVKISGFGTFKIINKKSRIGRNPKSQELYTIKPRKVVSFYPSKEVRKIINDKK